MKKLFQLFLCVGVIVTMFGCSKSKVDDDAIDRIVPAIQKFAELDSFDYEIGFEAPAANGKLYGSCLLEKMQLSLLLDLNAQGMKIEKFAELYIKDEMLYVSALGQKEKQNFEIPETLNVSFDPETVSIDKKSLKENLEVASIDSDKLHFEVKEKTIKEAIKSGELNVSDAGIDEVESVVFDIELENDFIKAMSLTIGGKTDKEDVSVTAYLKLDSINQKKAIDFPKGMEKWPSAESNK